jgi:4-amino-4-deoxy-L-arabinose transferase-like glycosyltransferase
MEEQRAGRGGQAIIQRTRQALPWAVLVAALAWGLGGYPLLDPDEGRNGEVAREMAASGDYVLPHLDGLPYLDKPVLFFAVDALSQRLLGAGEAPARLPALLFALATAALTGWFAGRLFGPRARAVATAAAIAAPLPIAFARTVIFDSALTFFIVAALAAFYLAVESRAAERAAGGDGSGPGRGGSGGPDSGQGSEASGNRVRHGSGGRGSWGYLGWTVAAWAAMGLGVLTKGPVALAVPLLAAAPFGWYRRAARAVWHPLGAVALAVVVGPWIWAMSQRVPEFLHYALFTETWQRVTTPEMNREGPIWLYVPCILAGALPWSVLVLAGWRHLQWRVPGRGSSGAAGGGGRDPRLVYLTLWIVLPFVMFSLTHSKRAQYILPLLPAVALLAAKVWTESSAPAAWPQEVQAAAVAASFGESPAGAAHATVAGEALQVAAGEVPTGARATGWTWLACAPIFAAAAASAWLSHSRVVAHATRLQPTLLAMAAGFLAGAVLLLWSTRPAGWQRRAALGRAALWLGLVLPVAAAPALALPLLDEIGAHRSSRAAAAAISPLLAAAGERAEVVGVRAYPPSLPFYLRRTILVASPRGRELTSNYVIAYFQKWLAADPAHTPLRRLDWWPAALSACDTPLVFVAWADDSATRGALAAAGLPLLVTNDRMAAYGPCRPHP